MICKSITSLTHGILYIIFYLHSTDSFKSCLDNYWKKQGMTLRMTSLAKA